MEMEIAVYLNTIDLDRRDRKLRATIARQIALCPYLQRMVMERSTSGNGWHYTLWCRRRCLKCRRKWDDPRHLFTDLQRPAYTRNVLFRRKILSGKKPLKIYSKPVIP